jgi:hypothetical protein
MSKSIEGVEVHEVEAATPFMWALVSRVVPTSRSTMRGTLLGFGILSMWSIQSKVIKDLDH